MDWVRILAYITGTVDQELLLRNEIEGLGDDAYLEKGSIGSFNKINVLVEGDFMLDTRANSPEQARGPAELALERLSGEGG